MNGKVGHWFITKNKVVMTNSIWNNDELTGVYQQITNLRNCFLSAMDNVH